MDPELDADDQAFPDWPEGDVHRAQQVMRATAKGLARRDELGSTFGLDPVSLTPLLNAARTALTGFIGAPWGIVEAATSEQGKPTLFGLHSVAGSISKIEGWDPGKVRQEQHQGQRDQLLAELKGSVKELIADAAAISVLLPARVTDDEVVDAVARETANVVDEAEARLRRVGDEVSSALKTRQAASEASTHFEQASEQYGEAATFWGWILLVACGLTIAIALSATVSALRMADSYHEVGRLLLPWTPVFLASLIGIRIAATHFGASRHMRAVAENKHYAIAQSETLLAAAGDAPNIRLEIVRELSRAVFESGNTGLPGGQVDGPVTNASITTQIARAATGGGARSDG